MSHDRTFKFTDDNGRTWRVMLRGAYQGRINARNFQEAVSKGMESTYKKPFTAENFPHTSFWQAVSLLGMVTQKWLIK